MKKLFKWIGILLLLLVVLVVGTAVVLPLVIDPNEHKERIVSLVEDQTGRSFDIAGEIEWSVFPFIGLGLNDLTLGNADGFSAPHMAKIQSADVTVKLRPLLSKEVEIGGIALNGLDLNLETLASGLNNWAGLSGSEQQDSNTGGSIDRLQVGFFELTDSQLNWIKPGQTTRINQIDISTGKITTTEPIEIDYSVALESEDLKLAATLAGKADVRNALGEAPILATISDLSLEGTADTISFELAGNDIVADLGAELIKLSDIQISGRSGDIPFEGKIDGGSLNLAADSAELPSMVVNSGPLQMELTGAAQDISEQMKVSGTIRIPELDPRALLDHVGQDIPDMSDRGLLAAFSMDAEFDYGADRAAVKNLIAQLDQTKLQGSVELSSIERLAGRFDLNIDQLDLDGYLPPSSDDSASDGTSARPDLDFGNLNGRVRLGRANFSGAELTNLDLNIRTSGKGLTIKETASLYDGQSSGGFSLDAETGRMQFDNRVAGVQANPLLKALTDSDLLSGVGELNLDVDVDDVFAANPIETLNGTVSFTFNDGAIMGFNVFSMLRQASAKLGLDPAASEASFEQTDFSRFVFSAEVVDGILQTNQFDLRSPFLRAAGGGSINLADMSLDYTLRPTLVQTPEGQGGAALDQLQGVEIPLGIGGTVFEPKLRLDPQALLLAWQGERIEAEKEKLQSRIDEEKDKLTDRLAGKLFGDRSDEEAEEQQADAGGDAAPPANEATTEEEDESVEDRLKGRLRGRLGGLLGGKDKDEEEDGGE